MMTFLGTGGDQPRKIRLYRNGDDNFFGKDFVLNPRHCRDYDVLLQLVTDHLQFGKAVRSIHTPVGGTRVTDLKTFKDRADYVAVSNGRFKNIPYPELYTRHVQKLNECKKRKEKNQRKEDHDDNRIHVDVSRGTTKSITNDVISIWVYCNGEEFEPARRVILTPRMLQNWGIIYTEINQHINPHFGAVRCLYSMDGSLVSGVDQLRSGSFFVASSKYSGFKNVGYGARRAAFNVSTKLQHQQPRLTEEQNGMIDEHPDGSFRGGGGGGGGGRKGDSVQTEPLPPSKPKPKKKRASDAQVIYSDGTLVFRRHKKKKKAKKANKKKADDEDASKKSSNFRASSPYDETRGAEEIQEQQVFLSELNEDQYHNTRHNNGYKSGVTQTKDTKERGMEGTSHQEGGVRVIHSREYTPDDAATAIQTFYRTYRKRQRERQEAASKTQATDGQPKEGGGKEEDETGNQVPSPVANAGSGHDSGMSTTRPEDGAKSDSPKTEAIASDPPKQDPGKSGSDKEEGKPGGAATKEASQTAVPPPTKEAVKNSSKESSKDKTKNVKNK